MATFFAPAAATSSSIASPATPQGGAIPPTIVTINGVDYNGTARAIKGFLGINSLRVSTDGYDSLSFVVQSCGPTPPFPPGSAVTLATTAPDGSNRLTRFVGDLQDPEINSTADGWQVAYAATGLKKRTDYLCLFGPDGSGVAAFNLDPTDPNYLQSAAGQTVGQIVTSILQTPLNASPLMANGVGNFTLNKDGTYTLPRTTQGDLANFVIVPTKPWNLRGQGILTQIEAVVEEVYPQYCCYIDPTDRSIRFRSPFAFPPVPLTFPGDTGEGDPLDPTSPKISLSGCYTSYQFIGLDIDIFRASVLDKTLVPAWATADQAKWNILDFDQPTDSSDQGAASSVTSTSVVVHSDDATVHWIAQFWQARGGVIELVDTTLGGTITSSETRTITSCTALSAGGTATITWDSSQPISSSAYNRYRIEGLNSPLAEVGRLYTIKGLNAPIYPTFPKPIWWSNNSSLIQISYPGAKVQWSGDGSGNPPFYELGLNLQLDRDKKQLLLAEPAVKLSAPYQNLKAGYPTTQAGGLYHDVLAAIPYMRGQLNAAAPASGYSGTAYTTYGLQRPFLQPAPEFTDRGELANYTMLAREKLACVQDALIEGEVIHHGWPANFDPLALGYSLNLVTPGTPSPLDGIMLPVRDVEIIWPNDGPDLLVTKLSYSNRRRPFEGDDQFIHPQFAQNTVGLKDGDDELRGEVDFGRENNEGPIGFGEHDSYADHAKSANAVDFGSPASFSPAKLSRDTEGEAELPELGEFAGDTRNRNRPRQDRAAMRREAIKERPARGIAAALQEPEIVPIAGNMPHETDQIASLVAASKPRDPVASPNLAENDGFGAFGGDPGGAMLPGDPIGGM